MSKKFEVELGKILKENEGDKDAIHIAVIPVYTNEILSPSQYVKLSSISDGKYYVSACSKKESVGIVDPWLPRNVKEGDRFNLCLNPYTITSLRHAWEHPLFKKEEENSATESVLYLKRIAVRLGMSYDKLFNDIGSGRVCLGYETPDWLYSEKGLILEHYNKIAGTNNNSDDFYFSCAC